MIILKQHLQYLFKIFKFSETLGFKEDHRKISSLRPIKYFMEIKIL